MPGQPRLIGSEIYRRSSYGGRHPLAIPRVSLMLDLVRALGWLPERAYVDATPDAHHGDGVEDAFRDDPRVLTISIHERDRWPHSGTIEDQGPSWRNLPVPPGFNDTELAFLMDEAVLPLAQAFAPEALVIQCGADGLADDPMSKLALSNRALWRAVAQLCTVAPRVLVLGGGGYNPWAVARCWTGIWATVARIEIPARLPEPAERLLRAVEWRHALARTPPERWFTTLADPPNDGLVRAEVSAVAAAALGSVKASLWTRGLERQRRA